MNYEGEKFLLKLYRELYNEESVIHSGSKSDDKFNLVNKYLKRLESTEKAFNKEKTGALNYLKNRYYDKYVIKEIPKSHYKFLERKALERGEGRISFNDKKKEEIKQDIIREQQLSLDKWINYLMKENTSYPMWARYWAFQGMLKLGIYDKETHSFSKRSKNTTSPFIELNPETLAKTMDSVIRYVEDKEITDEKLNNLIDAGNFGKIYAYNKWRQKEEEKDLVKTKENEGKWITFTNGEYKEMIKSLEGKGTGWCIVGEITAKDYLEQGDMHIYFTKDKDGKYTIPRVAIRQKNGEIEEVRGIEKDQNMEECMVEITDKKLDEFPDKEDYKRKVKDVKFLTKIYEKQMNGKELTKEEIYFIYEVNRKILGFGWEEDPRIEEILKMRNPIEDGFKYLGDITEINGNANFIKFPEVPFLNNLKSIKGNADFNSLTSSEGLENLEYVGGVLKLDNLKDASGLNKLKTVGKGAFFSSLEDLSGLENLEYIGGIAGFGMLESARSLKSLKFIGGSGDFASLESADGLDNLEYIGGSADFWNLRDAQNLKSLESIGGVARFYNLENASGLENLKIIKGPVDFHFLKDSKGLENLELIEGNGDFSFLENAKGLIKLRTIQGDAYFDNLKNASGLENLKIIFGDACFSLLENAEGLKKLSTIEGSADFRFLKSAKGLENLQSVGKSMWLHKLEQPEGLENLREVDGKIESLCADEIEEIIKRNNGIDESSIKR